MKAQYLPQAKPQRAASALTAVEHLEGRDAEFCWSFSRGSSHFSAFKLFIILFPDILWPLYLLIVFLLNQVDNSKQIFD